MRLIEKKALSRRRFVSMWVATLAVLPAVASAQTTGNWNVTAGGLWSNATNWSGGSVADGSTATANFNLNITADTTVNLDSARTIGNLLFHDATTASHSWVLANNGVAGNVLTLDNSGNKPTITVLNSLASGRSATISANLAGSNGFVKASNSANGTGLLILSGNNSALTGGITIEQGSLRVASDNALGSNAVTIQANGTASTTNFQQLDITAGRNISNNITINSASAPVGLGMITLSDNASTTTSTLSGTVTINAGASGGGHFGGIAAGAATGGGLMIVTGQINGGANAVSFRSGNFRLAGGGNSTNLQVSTYLRLGANNGLTSEGRNALLNLGPSASATFDLDGFNQTLGSVTRQANTTTLTNTSTTASVLTLDNSTITTYNGGIAGNLGVTVTDTSGGSGGGWSLTGTANSNTGPVRVLAGTLRIASVANGGSNSSLGAQSADATNLVLGNGTLDYTGGTANSNRALSLTSGGTGRILVSTAAANLTLAGIPNPSTGNFNKSGPGTLTFSGNLAYTGTTTVDQGVLIVNGIHTGAGAYTVNGGFGGAGTITGPVTLNTDGPVVVGTGSGSVSTIGTLTTGSLTVNGGGYTFNFDLGSTTATGGTSSDLIVVNGNLSLPGSGTVRVNPVQTTLASGEYGLIRYTGALSGDAEALTLVGTPTTSRQTYTLATGSIGADNYLKLVVTGNPANLTWNGGNGNNNWDLTSTVNWQRNAPLDEKFFSSDMVTFNDSSTNNAVAIVGTVDPSAVMVNTNGTYTFTDGGSGVLGGVGSLTKAGTGTLVMAVSAAYTGSTTISAGTLQIGNGGTVGGIGTGPIVNNGALVSSRSDGVTLNQVISGTGGITNTSGNLVLGGANTFDGPVVLNGGTMFPNNNDALGSTVGNTTVNTTATVYITGGNYTIPEAFVLAGGTLRSGGGRTVTLTGSINLTAASTINNDGTSRFVINNNVTGNGSGDLTVTGGGSTVFGGDLALGAGRSVQNTGNMIISPALATTVATVSSPISGTGSINFAGPGSVTVTGALSTAQTVNFSGTGVVTLAAANAFSGVVNVNNGQVVVTDSGAFGTSSPFLIGNAPSNGANLVLSNNVNLTNNFTVGGRELTAADFPSVINASGTNTLSGTLSAVTGGSNYNFRSDAGLLVIAGNYNQSFGSGTRTLKLFGDGDGKITGAITSGTGAAISISKFGNGTWSIEGTTAGVTGNVSVTAGRLNVKTPLRPVTGSLVVTGPGVASLQAAAHSDAYVVAGEFAGLTASSGGLISLAPTNRQTDRQTTLIAGTISVVDGKIDLGNNDAIFRSAPEAEVRSAVATWWNQGRRNGNGLGASMAGTGTGRDELATLAVVTNSSLITPLTTINDVLVASTDILVKYTYIGDTNLDGLVDGTDLSATINAIRSNGTLTGWVHGDNNYDGVVDANDLANLLTVYRLQGTPFGNSGIFTGGAIPEPATLGLLALTAPLMGRRRR